MTVAVRHAIGAAAFCSWTVVALALECSAAVDVGHFLARPGATSARGRTEFEFNVGLARTINSIIEQRGCRVTLIGERGDAADLKERTARAQGAGLFLSVHHDFTAERFLERWVVDGVARSYTDRIAGFSLFVSHANAHSMQSLRCASAIGARLRAHGFVPSLFHADPDFGEVRPFADRVNGVHWFDDLVVLKTATQPAVLIETGVLVNREEEIMLQRRDVRERIAAAVVDGALACVRDRP